MVNDVLDGVTRALTAAFPESAVYADERVRQGLQTPSFFVGLGEYTTAPLPAGRKRVRQQIEVTYFPKQQGNYGELWNVGEAALACLSEITLPDGGMLRGTNLRCFMNDGMMHIHAVYNMRLRPVENGVFMGDIRIQT